LRKIKKPELLLHKSEDDLWVVVDGKVYDLTKFHQQHPGGPEIIINNAGKDGS
jgi:cytochrome b involved in lipid metabolism